ncbi:Two-component sensory box histidine kinase [gamma proteobacterium HdN1]|nr:Two-component sensory box histidine kinase [gamma proteobacterium HdN1]
MTSLQRQLRRNMLLTLLITLIGLLFLLHTGVQQLINEYVLSRLQHDAESIIVALQQDENGDWQIDDSHLPASYSRVESGYYYRVSGPATDLRSRSLWDYEFDIPHVEAGKTLSHYQIGMSGEHWLTWSTSFRKRDAWLTVWVGEDIQKLQQTSLHYGAWAALILLLTLLLLILVQQWVLKRGFAQLDNVRDAVRNLRTGESTRLSEQYPQEIQPLVTEINRLLERLQQRVSRSRNALGNLAHEMKRPLQHLKAIADLRATEGKIPTEIAQNINERVAEITHLVERELKRARIVGVSSPGRHTVLKDELPTLLDVLKKIHPHCEFTSDYPSDLILPQDRDDMLELFGNLLDNASKYGANRVSIRIATSLNGIQIRIEDNGPGIPDGALQELLQRGARLDERIAGAGLGLGICNDIATSYHGSLRLENLPRGGLRVTVELPLI